MQLTTFKQRCPATGSTMSPHMVFFSHTLVLYQTKKTLLKDFSVVAGVGGVHHSHRIAAKSFK